MSLTETKPSTTSIDAKTRVGVISLSVANLDRSIGFYVDAIGFAVLRRDGPEAVLGAAGTPLLLLHEQAGALPWLVDGMTGLYHFAILVPTRVDLGRWLGHYLTTGYPPPGQGDHIVSEALYLRDPDGHGIEVYADRPRAGWVWSDGKVRMGGGPVDVRSMLADARATGQPWTGLPAGTTLGHIHLQVGDIAEAESFYHDVLGFDVVSKGPSALFVSAGGYHHHLGMNIWHSKGASPAPADTTTMRFFSIELPTAEARAAVLRRIANAGLAFEEVGNAAIVRDPWQNGVVLHAGPVANADDAEALVATLGPAR